MSSGRLRTPVVLALLVVGMPLARHVAAQTVAAAEPMAGVTIAAGSGSFLIEGGQAHPEARIRVFYHRPNGLDASSPVMIVIPGAGRNGDDYRDAWVEHSEKFGVLVLAPSYPERYYPGYWSYNLGGMTSQVKLRLDITLDTDADMSRLAESDEALDSAGATQDVVGHTAFGMLARQMLVFDHTGLISDVDVRAVGLEVNHDTEGWIFSDFDRIFELARDKLDLDADGYDLFGHSAGGQVLHRMALFWPASKARRIVAANSGWYTIPDFMIDFPYGLAGTPVDRKWLADALGERLVVFLGEMDDANETRGDLRNTPEADRQGPGRLSRGQFFFRQAEKSARQLGVEFRWNLEVVPGVGHDYRRMSAAAADYLYGR